MWIIGYVLKTSKMSRIQYMDVYFRFHIVEECPVESAIPAAMCRRG